MIKELKFFLLVIILGAGCKSSEIKNDTEEKSFAGPKDKPLIAIDAVSAKEDTKGLEPRGWCYFKEDKSFQTKTVKSGEFETIGDFIDDLSAVKDIKNARVKWTTYPTLYTLRRYKPAHRKAFRITDLLYDGETSDPKASPQLQHSQMSAIQLLQSEVLNLTNENLWKQMAGSLCSSEALDAVDKINAAIGGERGPSELAIACQGDTTSIRKSVLKKFTDAEYSFVVSKLDKLTMAGGLPHIDCPASIQQIDVSRGEPIKVEIKKYME